MFTLTQEKRFRTVSAHTTHSQPVVSAQPESGQPSSDAEVADAVRQRRVRGLSALVRRSISRSRGGEKSFGPDDC